MVSFHLASTDMQGQRLNQVCTIFGGGCVFRYRSMGLATVQSKERLVRMKVLKEMNRSGVESMRSKMGLKNNVIRNLPKN